MTFLEKIFERLQLAATAPVLREIRNGKLESVTGGEFWPWFSRRAAICRRVE